MIKDLYTLFIVWWELTGIPEMVEYIFSHFPQTYIIQKYVQTNECGGKYKI